MEGSIAPLPDLVELCRRHDAVLMVDDSHATGVLGEHGRGTAEHFGLVGEIDIITSTLGKALGGAAGGFVAGSAAVCDYLTQRARPQLFSNALPPTVAASALASVEYLEAHPERVATLRDQCRATSADRLLELGFKPLPGETPIIPVILGETAAAIRMSELLLGRGRVRHRLRLSGGAAGPGARALPDLGGPHPRRSRPGARRVRQGRVGSCSSSETDPGQRTRGSSAEALATSAAVPARYLSSLDPTPPNWPRPCTSTPSDGWGRPASRLDKLQRSKRLAGLTAPPPFPRFPATSRILTDRADCGRGSRQDPPGADTLRRQSVMRMSSEASPAPRWCWPWGRPRSRPRQPGNGNFQWYVGGQGGVTFFKTPTQGRAGIPTFGGHTLIVAKRTGLMLSVDEGVGSDETSSPTPTAAACQTRHVQRHPQVLRDADGLPDPLGRPAVPRRRLRHPARRESVAGQLGRLPERRQRARLVRLRQLPRRHPVPGRPLHGLRPVPDHHQPARRRRSPRSRRDGARGRLGCWTARPTRSAAAFASASAAPARA